MVDSCRLQRALNQRMYLLNYNQTDNDVYNFYVEGSSAVNYHVSLRSSYYTCNCPDHQLRNSICKHILFAVYRVLKVPLDTRLDDTFELVPGKYIELNNMIRGRLDPEQNDHNPDQNSSALETCVICFEEDSKVTKKCTQCTGIYHEKCLAIWTRTNKSCPCCRIRIKELPDNRFVDLFSKFGIS
jgi:uncharacterized Zn finger protein